MGQSLIGMYLSSLDDSSGRMKNCQDFHLVEALRFPVGCLDCRIILEEYLPTDHHLFQHSRDHILQNYDDDQQKQWLASAEAAKERFTFASTRPVVDPALEAQRWKDNVQAFVNG